GQPDGLWVIPSHRKERTEAGVGPGHGRGITGVSRARQLAARGDVSLRRFSPIHAENGLGGSSPVARIPLTDRRPAAGGARPRHLRRRPNRRARELKLHDIDWGALRPPEGGLVVPG